MKYHELRLRIPSDDSIKLDLVQAKVIEMLDAKGIEVMPAVPQPVAVDEPGESNGQGEMSLVSSRRRILWPASEVLQHAGRAFAPRAPRQKAR
jgi:hypothetical protein